MTFIIRSTPLQPSDLEVLLAEVNASPFIGGWSRAEIDRHLADDAIRFFYDGELLAGVSAWILFQHGQWCELGPFFAREAVRGRGLGRQLMATAVDINRAAGRGLYGVTKNDIVKRLFSDLGLQVQPLARLPAPVLGYLVQKMTPARMLHGLRKLDREHTIAHFIALPPPGAPDHEPESRLLP